MKILTLLTAAAVIVAAVASQNQSAASQTRSWQERTEAAGVTDQAPAYIIEDQRRAIAEANEVAERNFIESQEAAKRHAEWQATYDARLADATANAGAIKDALYKCIAKQQVTRFHNSREPADLVALAIMENCAQERDAVIRNVFFIERIPDNYLTRSMVDEQMRKQITAFVVDDRAPN